MWSKLHLLVYVPTFIVMGLSSFFVGRKLKIKKENIRVMPLKIIAAILIVLEICKQVVSLVKGYNLFHLPFHYCSLFLYLLPLFAFYNGKYKETIRGITLATCMSLFLVMIIYPTSIYSDSAIKGFFTDYLDFNSVIFHFLVCFYFFFMISLNYAKFDLKIDIKNICLCLLLYLLAVALISQILDTNFHGMRYCIVDFLDGLRISLANIVGGLGQAIYCLCVIIVSMAFTVASYIILKFALDIIEADNKKNRRCDVRN